MLDRPTDPSPLDPESAWMASAEVVWLPTAAEMAELDRTAARDGHTTERTLIESAGREIARLVAVRWPEGRIVAVAGSGHNGADALVAVRTLAAWGREVAAVLGSGRPPEPTPLAGWPVTLHPRDELEKAAAGAAVVLDGLLGTGLSGPPREETASLIRRLAELRRPVVAVDGPSGADFTTGAVPGECVRAVLTICLGWPKLGLLRHPARERCGEIVAVEIGFPPPDPVPAARAITPRWARSLLHPRPPGAHKGEAGYVAIVAGRSGMAGAAVLAARAALRGGAGVVRVVADPANRRVLQATVPGAIFAPWDDDGAVEESVDWAHAVVIGPGLGRSAFSRRLAERVLELRGERPALLDADALSVHEGALGTLAPALRPTDLLTPHPGELARLSGRRIEEIRADPPTAARDAATAAGCAVLLKGAPTLVATREEPLRVAAAGGPALAAGGTGDVLAGLGGALLAAGLGGADAGTAALVLSGLAAALSPEPVGHLASDLPDRLPAVRAALEALPRAPNSPRLFACPADPPGGRGG